MHHAYFISGGRADLVWQSLSGKRGNPDSLFLEFETLGIEEARALAAWALKKAFGERKVAVITLKSFTLEAQNALLKLFEEPPLDTYFFILLDNIGSILSTLLSRVMILNFGSQNDTTEEAESFLMADISKRFKIINQIIKNKDKEKTKALVSSLGRRLMKPSEIETVLKAEKFLSGRVPSLKMILESLVLTVK